MIITNFQKEIIKDIIDNKITDIYTFLEINTNAKFKNYIWTNYMNDLFKNVPAKNYLFEIKEDSISDLTDKLFQFIFLVDYLESNNLLYKISIDLRILKPIFVFENETTIKIPLSIPLYKINKLLIDKHKFEFFASSDLKQFVKNSYSTNEELKIEREETDRKTALNWTRIMAWVAIIAVIISSLFQIFKPDTKEIKVINNINTIDTSEEAMKNIKIEKHIIINDTVNK